MTIAEAFVLPADLILVPVEELSVEIQKQIEFNEGDYAITRPRARTPSKIVDAHTAEFLKAFDRPTTIVEAVISYSSTNQSDPEETLVEAFPLLQSFIQSRLLVPSDSEEANRIEPYFEGGDQVLDCEIIRCIQLLEDTELYQVRVSRDQLAILKILRPGRGLATQRMFEREAIILQHLDSTVSPALLDTGVFEERPYLLMEWCPGVDATVAAEEIRRQPGPAGRKKLLRLCCDILAVYAQLHEKNVVHSDIHPRNILVDSDGTVKIIDYGLARFWGLEREFDQGPRAGVGFFFEPEYARAYLAQAQQPQSSPLGEQYALAVLLYFLLTGSHYLEFSLEKDEMLRQIAEDRPLLFSQQGIKPWPEVEQILGKALHKDPAERFASTAEFAEMLEAVAQQYDQGSPAVLESLAPIDYTVAGAFLSDILQHIAPTGHLFASGILTAPTCSVKFGAAGVAYALYRIASVQDDPALLASADLWAAKAWRDRKRDDAFYNIEKDVTPETVGRISPYHTLSGVHSVQAFISHAMGDVRSQQAAIEAFVVASSAPCENLDLTLGQASTLLTCSRLLDTILGRDLLDGKSLCNLGDRVMQYIWHKIDTYEPIRECSELSYLGIAHGWAGLIYATLRWCQASERGLPGAVEERLQQLAECAEPTGRGARWLWVLSKPGQRAANSYMPGWCNGSAGYIFLWTLAYQIFGEPAYLALAEKAAWNTWEEPGTVGNLCCGFAGRAYGLLNLYKHTGEAAWLHRAQDLTNKAIIAVKDPDLPRDSLYKGDVGIAVLTAELARPEVASMPFFEPEG